MHNLNKHPPIKKKCIRANQINIANNKKFWQTLKPLFSDKVNNRETINLFDNGVTLAKDKEIFNKYFCNIAKNLSLLENPFELFTDPAIIALEQYIDHGSITSIKNKMTSMDNPKFSFSFVSINETWDRVNKLSPKKPCKLLISRSNY